MQIRCAQCSGTVAVADTGVLPPTCPHCRQRPVPEQLGRFRVVRLLAAGGMGEVYLGEHELLGTRVALKLLPVVTGADPNGLRERFRREARLTAAIDDPGVVQVLDLVEEHGRMFLVLELLDGESLRARLRRGALPLAEALRIAGAVATVLGKAHARAVVHRDVKPENVMLCRDGRVRVLDFGIARAVQDEEPLTHTGELLGTPEYMAPEQLLDGADAVDARTDVHALGVLTYELLTGKSPFAGSSLFQALKLVESLVPPPPSRLAAAVPTAVDAVIARALQKDRSDRFADGAEFAAALAAAAPTAANGAAAIAAPRPTWAHRNRTAALIVIALAAAAGGGYAAGLASRDDVRERATAGEPAPPAASPSEREQAHQAMRDGRFAAALQHAERALRHGDEAARGEAAVAWHLLHTGLPMAFGAPSWFACVDRERRDRLLRLSAGDTETGAVGSDSPLLQACRELALGRAGAAWRTLASVPESQWTDAHGALALLAANAACADPQLRAQVAARLRAPAPWSIEHLFDYSLWDASLAARVLADEQGPDRWLFEFAADAETALRAGFAPARLRSAAELAWLQGAGPAAPFWFVAVRTLAAAHGPALESGEAARLHTLFAARRPDEEPAGSLARALIDVAADPELARTGLRQAQLPDEPALGLFRALADGKDASAVAPITALLSGAAMPTSPLDAAPARDAVRAHALACAALGDLADDADGGARRRASWRAAIGHAIDFEALQCFAAARPLAAADLAAELANVVAATAAQGPLPPGFVSALRLSARLRPDLLGALRTRFHTELCDGIE